MGLLRWRIDPYGIDVTSDPLDPLQGLLNTALEAGARIGQTEGHSLVLSKTSEWRERSHEWSTIRVLFNLMITLYQVQLGEN